MLRLLRRRKKIINYYRINDRIQAEKLRVINADGTQLGIISRTEALEIAREQDLDLVEITTHTDPPVAKIIDFEKFRYQEEKKESAARKKVREVEIKEIWLSPRIAQHDLEVRLKKVEEFLGKGDKVKLNVKFRGREMAHPDTGYRVTEKALGILGPNVNIERETKFEGRNLTTIIGLLKNPKPKEPENKEEKQNEKSENNES